MGLRRFAEKAERSGDRKRELLRGFGMRRVGCANGWHTNCVQLVSAFNNYGIPAAYGVARALVPPRKNINGVSAGARASCEYSLWWRNKDWISPPLKL
jgi:hypothetical protein